MFNGYSVTESELSSWEKKRMNELLDYKLFGKSLKNLKDEYIVDSFKLYTENKCQIFLHLDFLCRYNDISIRDRFMYDMEPIDDIDPFTISDTTNLFRCDVICKLFHNLESVVMMTTDEEDFYKYTFSYACLLSFIAGSPKLRKVVIKGHYKWCKDLWADDQNELISMFDQKGFDICKKNTKYDDEEWIVIEKR